MSIEDVNSAIVEAGDTPIEPSLTDHKPEVEAAPEKPKTIEESIRDAQKAVEGKKEPKAEVAENAEADADKAAEPKKAAKPDTVKADADESAEDGEEGPTPEKAEAEKPKGPVHKAPDHFLPRAKEVWDNVPRAVKAEISRMTKEHSEEIEQYRAAHEGWETIKHYADMARQGGTDLRTALDRYVAMENTLRSNPAAGIAEVLRNIGLTPQQYAEFVLKNPQAANAPAPVMTYQQQAQQHNSAPAPEVAALKQQIEELQIAVTSQNLLVPFAQDHPRFHEPQMQNLIAKFLETDMVPRSLSPAERLEVAYDMAERINPASISASEPRPAPSAPAKPVNPLAGTKSIKGAPATGVDTSSRKRNVSHKDAINRAMDAIGFQN